VEVPPNAAARALHSVCISIGEQIITREPVFPGQPAQPPAQREVVC